jgi:5-methylcytosine-specific restriction endonuclease McrA
MPIKPENRHYYSGPAWQAIRERILERERHRCKFCQVINHAQIYRVTGYYVYDCYRIAEVIISNDSMSAKEHFFSEVDGRRKIIRITREVMLAARLVKIVLTIAHLDHNPANNDPANLAALCQMCHNRWDAKFRAENRKQNKQRKQ